MEKGLANTDTWKPVSGFGVKVRIPNGWRWAHQGAIIFAVEPSGNSAASFVVVGATDKDDAIAKLKESRDALKLETGKSSAQAPTMLGGISFLRQDYENSIADGKACHAMALVGDAPNGHGFVLVLGYVHEGQDPLSEDLRDAINSISPG